MSDVPAVGLNDGNRIPQLGFGVFQIDPDETAAAVKAALDVGYRHIDTAEMYGNEKEVGQGVRDAGLDRAEVFITSKLNNGFHKPDDARRAFDSTLSALGSDFVDLFLIHWPLPTLYGGDFVSTWHVLEEFARDGRARSIGVSNFQPPHLDRLAKESDTVPAVNQIEVHPYFTNESVRSYGTEHGIVTEAWSPIAKGRVLRPGHRTDRRRRRQVDGTGGVALAHSARRHRVPEVGIAGPDDVQLRVVRLRTGQPRDGRHLCPRSRRIRQDRAQPRHVRPHSRLIMICPPLADFVAGDDCRPEAGFAVLQQN